MSRRNLGVFLDDQGREQKPNWPEEAGAFELDDADMALYAMLCDPVYCAELLREDPSNRDYGGLYQVRDYQIVLNRGPADSNGFEIYACGRSVGKSESEINRSVSHVFRRLAENLLVTAPELIHLLPLTDNIEQAINDTRLTREFLDTSNGQTGFQHRPFQANFKDGTKIVGRIPRLKGTGVKGQHQPDLIVEEGQDYPEAGWIEVHERLTLDTPVLTPLGFLPLGEIVPGDEVVSIDGTPARVVGLSAVEDREILQVQFSDGSTVECDEDHLWTVGVPATIAHNRWQDRPTKQIEADLQKPGRACGSARQPWHVPTVSPIEFAVDPDLPLDPYVLGLLLGDGCIGENQLRFSTEDPELLDAVRQALTDDEHLVDAGTSADWWVRRRTRTVHARSDLLDTLHVLGLANRRAWEKHVPEQYLWASVQDRLALLQGLIDSDGHVNSSGAVIFITTSESLRRAVLWLARSLGGRATVSERKSVNYRTSWAVYFRLPDGMIASRLPRKANLARNGNVSRMNRRITAVVRTGRVAPTRCLQVDHPRHLFMVTDNLVPSRNTVMKDHTDIDGRPDFSYLVYGVHSGARDSGFHKRATAGGFKVIQVTGVQRPGWSAAEKQAAMAAYGGSNAPDYKRNILGEPGGSSTAIFNLARLVACMDQDRESDYNQREYAFQEIRSEEFEESQLPIADVLNLPGKEYARVWAGADLGLTQSPTVIVIAAEEKIKGETRLKLIRRIHLVGMRTRHIRESIYAIFSHFGSSLQGFGMDETGLGFPIWQEIEDDEAKPEFVAERFSGWFFNAKVPVGIEKGLVSKDQYGNLRDQYGAAVSERVNPLTNESEYVVNMPMIEASTRYMRKWVDSGMLMLPFDPAVIGDFQGDTQQRLKRISGLKNKPNAFHILDAFRAMSMAYTDEERIEAVQLAPQVPVLDLAV